MKKINFVIGGLLVGSYVFSSQPSYSADQSLKNEFYNSKEGQKALHKYCMASASEVAKPTYRTGDNQKKTINEKEKKPVNKTQYQKKKPQDKK